MSRYHRCFRVACYAVVASALAMTGIAAADAPIAAPVAADESWRTSTPWLLFGRMHPLTVHFPIALLLFAFVVDCFRRPSITPAPGPTVTATLASGTIAALIAAAMGWANADGQSFTGDAADHLWVHRWVGVTIAVLASASLMLALRLRYAPASGWHVTYRLTMLATALAVCVGGHFGSLLVYGDGYLTKPLHTSAISETPRPEPKTEPAVTSPATKQEPPAVDFLSQIEPILRESCWACHGATKQRGGLRLHTREAAFTNGNSGPSILPGDSEHSLLIVRVLGTDGEDRMPKNKPPLTDEQVLLLRRWIDAGATWPTAPTDTATPNP